VATTGGVVRLSAPCMPGLPLIAAFPAMPEMCHRATSEAAEEGIVHAVFFGSFLAASMNVWM